MIKKIKKNWLKITLFIVTLLIVILLGVILWLDKSNINFINSFRKINVQGQIFDMETAKPVADIYTISYANNQTKTGQNGTFEIKGISANSFIEISGPGLFAPFKVNINGKNKLKVNLSFSLSATLDPFFRSFNLRQYKKNYILMASAKQQKIAQEQFVNKANAWADDFTKNGYKLKNITYLAEKPIFSKDEESVLVKVNLVFEKDGKELTKTINTNFIKEKESGQWRWLYDESFFVKVK